MNKLKIRVWNINGRSGWGGNYEIPSSFIAPEIMGKECDENTADIIVLTEFVIAPGWGDLKFRLEEKGYIPFHSPASKRNGILIAIKKKIEGLNIESAVSSTEMRTEKAENPNFLQVTVTYKDKPLTIIGARIRIGDETTREDLLCRKEQLDALVDHLSESENVIGGGDFNNLKIMGDEDKKYKDVRSEYNYITRDGTLNVAYDTYNYHILKDTIEDSGYCLHTPKGNVSSWGKSFKQDHFITSKSIAVSTVKYSWDFKSRYSELTAKAGRLPDHAILSAEISID